VRIIHLARDEKFIPLLRELFETALPGANRWLIARRSRAKLDFVKAGPDVVDRAEWWFRTPLIARDVANADVLIAHSMTSIFAHAIRRAPASARAVWLGWGYDYYPLLEAELGPSILPATRALRPAAAAGEDAVVPAKTMALSRVAGRLHTFCVLPPEVALLRRALPALSAVHHALPLFTTEDVFMRGAPAMQGPDLLLGNSATASNNHVEALELLHDCDFGGRIVTPLSYGDAHYGQAVAALGASRFGERFDALRQWMSLDDYNRRIGDCGFVLMNHRRQQAVGNIGAALHKGATVYMRPENPLFAFYRELGLHLRSIDQLASERQLVALTADERRDNRDRIGAYYARERVLQAIRELPALQR
jgi:dTDP-N-acetylfucosamine:lipid II N-acetylfucosaminyltransferase